MKIKKPLIILIRDGWGYRKSESLNGPFRGQTPYTDYLMKNYPNTLINTCGEAVGLPKGFQGNSEVGHSTIGSGRIVDESLLKINKTIDLKPKDKNYNNKSFFKNPVFIKAINNCKKNKSKLHLLGLLQEEGVHAHINHCFALLDLCKKENFKDVFIHVISDGRDATVKNTINNVKKLENKIKKIGFGKIATISGRYFSMDRNQNWDRTQIAFDCIITGKININKKFTKIKDKKEFIFNDAIKHFKKSYSKKITDEFIYPSKFSDYSGVKKNDSFIFYNFRTDRPRQLTKAIVEPKFKGFKIESNTKKEIKNIVFVAMTQFYNPMPKNVLFAYKNEENKNLLGEIISKNKLKQLRISETEKYAHVTFFFNGQNEKPNKNEDRILIKSPDVDTYDMKPEMSVNEIGDTIIKELKKNKYDVIITNFVNGDMVGHTGNWKAVLKAVKSVDNNVKKVVEKTLELDGTILLFADHGNCEDMTSKFRTSHTLNKVPFVLISNKNKKTTKNKKIKLKKNKGLSDIAPTALKLLKIKKPKEMSGGSIF